MIGRAIRDAFSRTAPVEERGHIFGLGGDYGIASGGGIGYSAERALTIPVFYSGVVSIAEATRSIPMQVKLWDYEARTWLPTPYTRLEHLLCEQPNEEMSAADLYELVTGWMLIRGDGFGWKEYERDGTIKAVWPVAPNRVQVVRNSRTRLKEYVVYASSEDPTPVWSGTRRDLIHWRAWGTDSLRGIGLVEVMRGLIGRALDEDEHAAVTMKNMQKPSGVLEMPPGLGKPAMERLRAGWDARARGGTPILPDGVKYQRVSLSAADTQFVEQKKLTRGDFALAMRLPASRAMADAGGGSLHYDSAEMDGQEFITRTMLSWVSRLVDPLAIDKDLPWGYTGRREDRRATRRLRPLMDTSAFTRADDLKGAQADAIAIKQGWKTADEVRAERGLVARPTPPKPAPAPDDTTTETEGGDHAADAAA